MGFVGSVFDEFFAFLIFADHLGPVSVLSTADSDQVQSFICKGTPSLIPTACACPEDDLKPG